MRVTLLFLIAIAAWVNAAAASAQPVPEVRPFVGAFVPAGDQRDVLKDAVVTGMQAGVEVFESAHLVGSFAWSPNRAKALVRNNRVNLYQWDAGLELFRDREWENGWKLRPFAGAGVGGRTYDLRDVSAKSQSYMAGYGALGAELQIARVALRLEGRDYLSNWKGMRGNDKSATRNDVMLMGGFAYHLW